MFKIIKKSKKPQNNFVNRKIGDDDAGIDERNIDLEIVDLFRQSTLPFHIFSRFLGLRRRCFEIRNSVDFVDNFVVPDERKSSDNRL